MTRPAPAQIPEPILKARSAGFQACMHGIPIEACSYTKSEKTKNAWIAGYSEYLQKLKECRK